MWVCYFTYITYIINNQAPLFYFETQWNWLMFTFMVYINKTQQGGKRSRPFWTMIIVKLRFVLSVLILWNHKNLIKIWGGSPQNKFKEPQKVLLGFSFFFVLWSSLSPAIETVLQELVACIRLKLERSYR